jgi:protein O-mannosyl-transferase
MDHVLAAYASYLILRKRDVLTSRFFLQNPFKSPIFTMRIRYQIMLLTITVLVAYYPVIFAPMNSVDDPGLFLHLLNIDSFSLWKIFMPGGSSGYYRPLLQISFLLDQYVWGLEESFIHLDNILIHLCNTMIVFVIVRRVCQIIEWAPGGALVAALLFGVHPINTESVSWISGRTDPLAACFLLLSVLALLYRSRPLLSSLASALLMLLACLVKETAIFFLPAALILPFYLPTRNNDSRTMREIFLRNIPHFVIIMLAGAGYFLLRALALSKGDEGIAHVVASAAGKQSPDLLLILRMMLKAIGFYAKKLFIPFPLNFGITHVSDGYVLVGLLVCVAICYLVVHRTMISFFMVCAASIGSSAIMIAFLNVTWTPLAERYMYIPSAFFIIGITLSVKQREDKSRCHSCMVGFTWVLVIIGIYGTFTRSLLWQNNLAFFQDAVRKNPDFMPARNELATALKRQGRTQEAVEIYQSFQMHKDVKNYQYGMMSKAGVYEDNGDPVAARNILREVLKTPGNLEIMILQKMLEVNQIEVLRGKETAAQVYEDSVRCLTRLYELTGDPFYQYRLGVINLQGKHEQLALAAFREVCRTAATDAFYRKPAEKLTATLATKLEKSVTGEHQKL